MNELLDRTSVNCNDDECAGGKRYKNRCDEVPPVNQIKKVAVEGRLLIAYAMREKLKVVRE